MTWWPGWDSVDSAGFWSHFWFWVGIVCLFAVGASAVISHIYGLRKDELMSDKVASLAARQTAEVEAPQKRLVNKATRALPNRIRPRRQEYLRLNNSELLSRPLAPLLAKKSE